MGTSDVQSCRNAARHWDTERREGSHAPFCHCVTALACVPCHALPSKTPAGPFRKPVTPHTVLAIDDLAQRTGEAEAFGRHLRRGARAWRLAEGPAPHPPF